MRLDRHKRVWRIDRRDNITSSHVTHCTLITCERVQINVELRIG